MLINYIKSNIWKYAHVYLYKDSSRLTYYLSYNSLLIVKITFLEFHISLELISETGLFHNFYEHLFTGIDKNKEIMYFMYLVI